jgi:biotin/methionine sulfoxide reductase
MKRAVMLRLAALRGRLFTLFADEDMELIPLGRLEVGSLPSQEALMAASPERNLISQPMIRKGYYEHRLHSDETRRGLEPFVAVGWDEALDIVAEAIAAKTTILASAEVGSGSARILGTARFHDPASQLRRFLHCIHAGQISKVQSARQSGDILSTAIPGGGAFEDAMETLSTKDIVQNCKRVIFFGGASDQAQLASYGGQDLLNASIHIKAIATANIPIVTVSPDKEVTDSRLRPCWLQCRPGSEVAVILGVLHTLMDEGLHDRDFLAQYCTGFDDLESYVTGNSDGVPKNAFWAQTQSGIDASEILMLARLMAAERCLIALSMSLFHEEEGQQVYGALTALACALGYIGLPGGGLVSAVACSGPMHRLMAAYAVRYGLDGDQIKNTAARLGEEEGAEEAFKTSCADTMPTDATVLYLGGADCHRYTDYSSQPRPRMSSVRTVIIHARSWSYSALHADIVLPNAEFSKLGDLVGDKFGIRLSSPLNSSGSLAGPLDDYDIFSSLAKRLGFYQTFTDGRSSGQWLQYLYEITQNLAQATDCPAPDFHDFKMRENVNPAPFLFEQKSVLDKFRTDPRANPLSTLSGKIDLNRPSIVAPGHPEASRPAVWPGTQNRPRSHQPSSRFFQLVSDEPLHRFQSFLNFSATTDRAGADERQSVQVNWADAYELRITSGDVLSIVSARGEFLAEAKVSDYVPRGKVQLTIPAYGSLPGVSNMVSNIYPLNLAPGCSKPSVVQNLHKVLLYSYTVSVKKYFHERIGSDKSSIPTILYNVSPTAFGSASQR